MSNVDFLHFPRSAQSLNVATCKIFLKITNIMKEVKNVNSPAQFATQFWELCRILYVYCFININTYIN